MGDDIHAQGVQFRLLHHPPEAPQRCSVSRMRSAHNTKSNQFAEANALLLAAGFAHWQNCLLPAGN